jgi:arginase
MFATASVAEPCSSAPEPGRYGRRVTTIVVPYHLDDYLAEFDWPVEADLAITSDSPPDPANRWGWLAGLYESVASAISPIAGWGGPGRVPVVASGDCTTSLGTVAGLQRAGLDPAVVWFDAHGDVQTLETTTSGYLGGLPLRILVGYRPELISTALGLRPVPESRVTLVDARDLDPPEVDFLASSAIRHVSAPDLSTEDLPDGPLYLHIDLDVVDADQLPGLLFPAPGGPDLDGVFAAVGRVWATGRVVAVGLGCTWHPESGAADRVHPYLSFLSTVES